ncbi:5-formyltetrahydrofolate cyclo-ligase [Aliiruegeria lutimaris]|uniref:5-formyltetrahydrofolate cyclo-ligase n=1 Tax=Aliiruegeria lutimaris TaxID=571298 RepID=A0A1G9E0K3_9RHOB|nr:5-formyltetrahydrofolate cyclo-ligase [Aliiruegeria lutimaris]SDK69618.1 5-formyltetrahydrofolate cyclo-ligase [Aliiruegeria lutimaris]
MNLGELKKAARKRAFALRKAAHSEHRAAASQALRDHLAGTAGQIIAGYLPIRTEADPLPAMEALCTANRIAVPIVIGPGMPLVFREWRPGFRLEEGAFGVMIPMDGAELVPDLIIAPLVAFDRNLFRLGYGGGFYDRTLEGLRQRGAVKALGFAYSAQCLETLPLEATDQPLDGVLTERGVFPRAP